MKPITNFYNNAPGKMTAQQPGNYCPFAQFTAHVALLFLFSVQSSAQAQGSDTLATQPAGIEWQYGGFLDFAYLEDFNDPVNHLFRSRGTTFHVNEWDVNMAGIYLKKAASESSRWGTEVTLQAGK